MLKSGEVFPTEFSVRGRCDLEVGSGRCNTAVGGRGQGDKESRQLLEARKGKGIDSPLEPQNSPLSAS